MNDSTLTADRLAWDAEHAATLTILRPAWADDSDPVDGFGFGGPELQDIAFRSAPFEINGLSFTWMRSGVYNASTRELVWDAHTQLVFDRDELFGSVAELEDHADALRQCAALMRALHVAE